MQLTEEQAEVVALASGRHLVLAPPGSGKTEMLSRRIFSAIRRGVDPNRMLCATFTNRAAFEMRERVAREADSMRLPDVGNIHHFCHSFLVSVGRMHSGKHVIDEVQQSEFVHEVLNVLRAELRTGAPADIGRTHGVTVLRGIRGVCGPSPDDSRRGLHEFNPQRVAYLHDVLENYIADALKGGRDPDAEILAGVLVAHQRRIGIPSTLTRPLPHQVVSLVAEGVIDAVARAYAGLKRKFRCVDFDDLLNETYLFQEEHPLPEERRFNWVQIDEVQDLNPLQWSIVKSLTAERGVSVYFGDPEQAIFSFLGASATSFAAATADCTRHCFRTNFRATPLLLEILMRYSLETLGSDWEFLPAPADPHAANGVLELSEARLEGEERGINEDFDFAPVMRKAVELLSAGIAENVAILVRTNSAADICEECVKPLGYRYAKVSGTDLFSYAPMRDFMAFVSLFAENVPMTAWTTLLYRFGGKVRSRTSARYFVRAMFASGWDPRTLFDENDPIGLLPAVRSRAVRWAWWHRRPLVALRAALRPAVRAVRARLGGSCSFRDVFSLFADAALGNRPMMYALDELIPGGRQKDGVPQQEVTYEAAIAQAKERIEKFLRYMDHVYADDNRSLGQRLAEDWNRVSRLKEADLLVGDEKIVISTIHKAKGRQFDAVFIPNVKDVVDFPLSDPDEARRLLYVAMSRAKRHLFLWEANDESVRPLKPCFRAGYGGYYMTKARGGDLSGDWLATWEGLAEQNLSRTCDDGAVCKLAAHASIPVAKIALRTLRWSSDTAFRKTVYLNALEKDFRPGIGECAIGCLADCAMFGPENANAVRGAALRGGRIRIARAALAYFVQMPGRSPVVAREALGDFIYSRFPEIRVEAVDRLSALGVVRWQGIVTGAKADFTRLARVPDPEHESSIRQILASKPSPADHERALRAIIAARALS